MRRIEDFENSIEYSFKDKNLLKNALTHSSYASENGKSYIANNERLEFLGDAFLGAVIASKLFSVMNNEKEGVLSKKRAEIVCEQTLADIAKSIDLGDYLFLGNGEESQGGRDKSSILSDALEAVIGAIYLDGGFEECRDVVLRLFSSKIRLSIKGDLVTTRDFKSELQQKVQEKYHENRIEYVLVGEEGPAHKKLFTVELRLKGKSLGRGEGSSKGKAEQAAAEAVLKKGEI